jgi:hypothetical protein
MEVRYVHHTLSNNWCHESKTRARVEAQYKLHIEDLFTFVCKIPHIFFCHASVVTTKKKYAEFGIPKPLQKQATGPSFVSKILGYVKLTVNQDLFGIEPNFWFTVN